MTLRDLLQKNEDSIVQRWFECALETYAGESAVAFKRGKDPFANPVGHSLRVGTRGIFETFLDGTEVENARRYLHEIMKIRAVQEFPASEAVNFIFRLKEAIRAVLGPNAGDARFVSELEEFDRRIDRIALDAVDVYVQYREQLCDLRINEVKRSVSWVVDKINQRPLNQDLIGVNSRMTTVDRLDARYEGTS